MTNSQLRARARRRPGAPRVARPLTPPAQPRPKTGTRRTSARRPMPRADARFEAGGGDAGGRDGDDAVDLVGRQAGLFDRRARPPRRTGARPLRDRRRCARASRGCAMYQSMRSDDVAPGDPGIVEHARQPVEQGLLAAERARARGALASCCSITCGGTAVASESRLQGRIDSPISCAGAARYDEWNSVDEPTLNTSWPCCSYLAPAAAAPSASAAAIRVGDSRSPSTTVATLRCALGDGFPAGLAACR